MINTKKIHSSQIDFDRRKPNYKNLINEDEGNKINSQQQQKQEKEVEEKTLGLFGIYCHLNSKIDWIFIIFAMIGSLGSGIAMPLLSFSTSDVYSEIANTSENRDTEFHIEEMKNNVIKTLNFQIKKQIKQGIFTFFSYFINIFFWSLIGNRAVYNFKKKYFSVILSQEQAWFDENNPFLISTSVHSQIEDIESGIGEKVGIILSLFSQCIIGIIFAFISSWKLTLVMISIAPIPVFLSNYLVLSLRNGIVLSRRTWKKAGGIMEEMLYNIKTVTSFGNFDYELNRYYTKIDEVWKIDLKNAIKFGFAHGFINFFLSTSIFVGFLYGRKMIKNEYNYNKGREYTGGDVISATFCTLISITAIGVISPNIKTVQDTILSFDEYYKLFKRKRRIDLRFSVEKPPLEDINGKIEFHDVKFFYPSDPNQRIILNGINLLFESGKKVALVGESGCGKSTIVNLIERLYDINEGKIIIDGIEIKRYDLFYLRSLIGYVQQEPVLFNKSIRDNIIFGREDYLKTIGDVDELIKSACKEAYIDEFIDTLPDKLNYIVGVKGSKLSGGQKQRIAIARAILTRPKILILDKATSS